MKVQANARPSWGAPTLPRLGSAVFGLGLDYADYHLGLAEAVMLMGIFTAMMMVMQVAMFMRVQVAMLMVVHVVMLMRMQVAMLHTGAFPRLIDSGMNNRSAATVAHGASLPFSSLGAMVEASKSTASGCILSIGPR